VGLLGIFAAAAALLATLGIHGIIAYSVAQRVRELGIRMALGAAPADIRRLVVAQGVRLAALGLVIGTGVALLVGTVLQGVLHEVGERDLRVFGAAALLLGASALVASYLPARRAAAVDPRVAFTGDGR
jgi:putative ABC transport system permease protein